MSIIDRAKDKVISYLFRRMVGMRSNELDLKRYNNRVEIEKMQEIYRGNPYWLDYNAKSTMKASSIASYIANKVTLELESNIESKKANSAREEFINKEYQLLVDKARKIIELVLVEGSGILKPFVSGKRLGVDFLTNDYFRPIKFNDLDELVEVIFLNTIKINGKKFTKVEHHIFNELEGTYTIRNTAHMGEGINYSGVFTDKVPLSQIPEWADIQEEITLENIERPFYSYIKTPYADPNDVSSPLGVSLFTKILTQLKDYDAVYDSYMWEIEAKEAVYVIPRQATMHFEDELSPRKLKKRERLFMELDYDPSTSNTPYTVPSSEIRYDSYESAINAISRDIEFNVGLAYGELSNAQLQDKTATEVRASKERSYATISELQKSLKISFEEIVKVMDELVTLYSLAPDDLGNYEVTFYFDDSIAVERTSPMLEEVKLGILRPEYYLMERYGYTYDEAMERVYGKQEELKSEPNQEAETKDTKEENPELTEDNKENENEEPE